MKKVLIILLLSLATGALVACHRKEENTTVVQPTTPTQPAPAAPQKDTTTPNQTTPDQGTSGTSN